MKPDAEGWDRLCEGCLGDGCGECKKGWIREAQRPSSLITEEGADLFHAYQWLKNHGIMPVPGGFLQQSAAFVDAVSYCETVHSAFTRARERRNADVTKLAATLSKMTGKHAGR